MNNISELELNELKKIGKYSKENLEKLKNNYPIQYIIGYVDFFGYKIYVDENTLIPRYETEYLVEKTLNYIKKYKFENPKILDLCTGTGCIGLTLKKELPNSDITLSDISLKALKIANKNKNNLNVDVSIIESDLFKNIKNKFDIIISNPPYVMASENLPETVKYEPSLALYSGLKGIDHITKILNEASVYLNNKYIIALEINEQSKEDLTEYIENNYKDKITYSFEKDLTGRIRYLFIFKNCE